MTEKNPPINCLHCLKEIKKTSILSCVKCGCGKYCSHECMVSHKYHAELCEAICSLEEIEKEKLRKTEIFVSDSEKLPYKLKRNLISLVGERPLVKIYLNGVLTEGLWDTGAMISLMNKDFLEEHFPGVPMYSISDFIDNDSLKLTAANQTELGVEGVVVLTFGVEERKDLFQIPFVVTTELISKPIVGYNTIEHVVTNFKDEINLPSSLVGVIRSLSDENAENMVNLLEAGGKISELSEEARLEKTCTIFPGVLNKIRCKIKDLKLNNIHDKLIARYVVNSIYLELCNIYVNIC